MSKLQKSWVDMFYRLATSKLSALSSLELLSNVAMMLKLSIKFSVVFWPVIVN